jgi:HAD superfamily hydrolase (TIGR01458 family)
MSIDATNPKLDWLNTGWNAHPIRGLILDIDGVLEFQGLPCPGAPETLAGLREMGLKLCFLTNSTLKSRASCAARLRQKGFAISDDEVITASSASAAYLRLIKPRSCWVLVEGAGIDEFAGLPHDEQNPEVIVIGDNYSRFNCDTFNRILRLLKRGARLIGMQPELVDSSSGELELNVGSFVEMLARAAQVQPVYIGKPACFGFELALEVLQLHRREVVVVGDRIDTDIQGAAQCGFRSVLVRSGEYDPRNLLASACQPDQTISSFTELPEILSGLVKVSL